MAVKFFGQFLVEKGFVSREQLLEALKLQESTNLKFGEMALSMGLLTEADVERVHNAQLSEDLRFGDAAVKLGLLTEEQVQQIATRQQNSYLYIGRALVEIGALDADRLERYLKDFQDDQAPYRMDRIDIPAQVPHSEICETAADLTYKMLTRVAQLPHRSEQCRPIERLAASHVVATMAFSGAATLVYLFSVSAGIQETIARAILKADDVSGEPQEVLDDTLCEFINIVCGNVAAKGAQLGYRLEIAPPEALHAEGDIEVPEGHVGLVFPIHVVNGERVDLALFVKR